MPLSYKERRDERQPETGEREAGIGGDERRRSDFGFEISDLRSQILDF
jgi:hypothetical protein